MSDESEGAHVPECIVEPGFKFGSHKSQNKNKDKPSAPVAPSLCESISFPVLLASLPRWILNARTPFSGFFAKSFHVSRCGSSPASVVFPLPLPQLGLFRSSGPKLCRRRWISLCRKRVLHLLVVALNFLHFGFRPDVLPLLGRRPNALHLEVFDRLWSFIATCDSPGAFDISPGRSGPEFMLRLYELQRFAEENPQFSLGSYGDYDNEQSLRGKIGKKHRADLGDDPGAFEPYRSLDPSRLRLTGEGRWPLADFLDDELWLPYLEPLVLRHGLSIRGGDLPNFKLESSQKNLELALLWSTKGLLALFPDLPPGGATCRVFNCFKNATTDRQIGDRRMPNFGERSIQGPSKHLPGGYLLTSIHVPRGNTLYGSITDRKDFYHQARVSRQRAHSNVLAFSYPRSSFEGTEALAEFDALERRKGDSSRRAVGDKLKGGCHPASVSGGELYPGFASLYQGDHLGVEYALSAHQSLLCEADLLRPQNQVRGNSPFPFGPDYECLVIDDYVAMSVQPVSNGSLNSFASCALGAAKAVYERYSVLGSTEKDVDTSDCFKAIGTQFNASRAARSRGIVCVSSPPEKIASLIALSCRVAVLPVISRSLASRLAGCWTSVLLHRRCLSCVLDRLYSLGVREEGKGDEVLDLPRSVAQELLLCSSLAFVAATDVSVPYLERIYATDASLHKGAITSREVPVSVAKVAWLGGDKKGAYTRLDNPFAAALRARGLESEAEDGSDLFAFAPSSGLDFAFDFVEICGGSGVVSEHASRLGLVVCTPIELSDSPHFDLENPRLVEWICFMLQKGRFRSVMLEPPCTTFSAAAHPCVRSYRQPLGFDRLNPKTFLGNLLAFRCFAIMLCAYHAGRPNLLEQPLLSKMAWLSVWTFLRSLGFSESQVASCQFGSIHKKPFRLLSWGLDAGFLSCKCKGGHQHVRIEGALTKPSSVYVPKLAEHFARAFLIALAGMNQKEKDGPPVAGLESVLLNDLLMTGEWTCDLKWNWRHATHINLLESNSYVTLLKMLASRGLSGRFTCLLDSRVAKGCHAKGRSSARALGPGLRRAASISIASGLYGSFGFAPTRLNTADDPTRERPVRPSSQLSVSDALPVTSLQQLHSFQFSRPCSGWIRLFVLLSFFHGALGCGSFPGVPFDFVCSWHQPFPWWILLLCVLPVFVWLLPGHLIFSTPNILGRIHVAIAPWYLLCHCSAMPLTADSGEEHKRASRRGGIELFADRVVRQKTRTYRDTLLEVFDSWLGETFSVSLDLLLEAKPIDSERIAELLTIFGREMYYAGKPYGRYSETINALASRKPAIRRNLGLAWDLAFAWQVDEPREHHVAMPVSVLLAVCGLALLWGWPTEAAVFALTWSL